METVFSPLVGHIMEIEMHTTQADEDWAPPGGGKHLTISVIILILLTVHDKCFKQYLYKKL